MVKNIKWIKVSRKEIWQKVNVNKLLAKSLENTQVIINQFNKLKPNERLEIKKAYSMREEKLKKTLIEIDEDKYFTAVMIELNIIASQYNIDPATVCMCIDSPCMCNEKLILK